MLRSKTNQWGHAGTTEYALERSIPPPLFFYSKPGRTSKKQPTRFHRTISRQRRPKWIYWILGNHHKYGRPIERECRVVQRSLEEGDSEPKEGDSRRQLTPFSIERNSQTYPAGWSISVILSAGKAETDDHGPDLTSTVGLLINEAPQPTIFYYKLNQA
jgi:hypothetical protein